VRLGQSTADALVHRFEHARGAGDPLALPPWAVELRARVSAFVAGHVSPRVSELDRHPSDGQPDPHLVSEGARAGLLTLAIPAYAGGDGRLLTMARTGILNLAVALEELAAGCAGVATLFGAHHLGLTPILLSGDFRQHWRLLRPIARSARSSRPSLCAFAITEPGAGSDVEDRRGSRAARLSTFARKVAGGYVLDGRKCFISNGSAADLVTVFAALSRERGVDSWTCFALRRGSPGFHVGRVENKMGQRASPTAELVFDGCFVPEADRIGREGQGWQLNQMTLDTSRVGVAAIALGAARGALDQLVVECRRRRLGSRPLLAHAEVRLQIADLAMKVETLRSVVWRAARVFPPSEVLSATAKCTGADVAVDVCERSLALLGDAGLDAAVGLEKRLRDARLLQIYEGTNQINRLVVADALGLGDGALDQPSPSSPAAASVDERIALSAP
jgi:alkylation response protein AidB-like acyl-CoA dehydrogenase